VRACALRNPALKTYYFASVFKIFSQLRPRCGAICLIALSKASLDRKRGVPYTRLQTALNQTKGLRRFMSEGIGGRCSHCGAALLPGRRYCVACLAQVPVARAATEDRLTELMRETPSTHRQDQTMVFVPEIRDARSTSARGTGRAFMGASMGCVALAVAGFAVWRALERKQAKAQSQRRES